MKKRYCYLSIILLCFYCCLPKEGKTLSGDIQLHDPSGIIRDGNKYWMFSTGEGIHATYSTDLFSWKGGNKPVFEKGYWPAWINEYVPGFNGSFWAPEIIYNNGRYYLYYSCSQIASPISAIGVASSPTLDQNSPEYKWTDHGRVVSSESFKDINAIDPAVFKDTDGRLYLTYGSYFNGIAVIELDPLTAKVKAGATLHQVAGGNNASWEAPYLMKEGAYYYLFVNKAYCCTGTSSTYYIVTGRSTSPTGPFADKNGIDLRGNNAIGVGTPSMVTSGRYIGPGHFGLLQLAGRNIVSTHYYDRDDNGIPKLDIAQLQFSADGWPLVTRNYLNAGRYKISNNQSELLWEAPGCSGTNAHQILLRPDHNMSCQQWNITPVGDGYYKVSNDENNFAVDVPNCNASNGSKLQGWTWLNNDCQKFKIEQTAGGQYVLTALANRTAAKVIQVGQSELGVSLFDYNGAATQQWIINEVPPPVVQEPTNITDSCFTVKWSSVEKAHYRLDVFTSLSDAAFQTIAAWEFQAGTNKTTAGIPVNAGRLVTTTGTNTATFNAPGNGGKTAQATGWEYNGKDKYWEVNFTTTSYYNIKVSSKQRSVGDGPRHFKLQYKIGEAGTYTDIPGGLVSNLDNFTAGLLENVTLPPQCDNQPSVYLRWLALTTISIIDRGIDNSARSNIDDIVIIGNHRNFLPGYENLLIRDSLQVVTGLPPGTDFFFQLREVRGTFTSVSSDVRKVTTTGLTPVNFANINAREKSSDIEVGWTVTPENNVAWYEVEKSTNGHQFSKIGTLRARSVLRSAETYNFLDELPLLNYNFYRVKAILTSGVVKYSPTVNVYREKGDNGIYFYPNPTNGKNITLQLFNLAAGSNEIQILNSAGQRVYSTQFNHAGGAVKLQLQPGNLSTGVYYFSVRNGASRTAQAMIVNNR